MDQYEYKICYTLNRYANNPGIRKLFTIVSRLGNGVFWYSLILLLPVIYGKQALQLSLVMVMAGLAGLVVYKTLKNTLVRQRPCIHYQTIQQATAMLDYYSFPSGHTLHAFSFSTIAIYSHPELAIILLPVMLLVALSRVILGLHYPSDVLVGAAIGLSIAGISIQFQENIASGFLL